MAKSCLKEDEIMVAFKMKKQLYDKLKDLTAVYSSSISSVIRYIIQDYLNRNVKETK